VTRISKIQDPYFESVPATRLDGRPNGKVKKRRKALPPGISDHDGKVLTKVKRRAYRLDMSLCNFCGIRFGWSSIIALLPVLGDALDAFMALMVVQTCTKIEGGLPTALRARMMMNIALDFAVGLVPIVGDVADALFRANTRNAALLEAHLREKGKKTLRQSGLPIPTVDPSDPDEFDRLQREDPPRYEADPPARQGVMSSQGNSGAPKTPAAANVHEAKRSFFGFSSRSQPQDVEMGIDDSGNRRTPQQK